MFGTPCVQDPMDRRWLASGSFGTSRLFKTTAWPAEGGRPLTYILPIRYHEYQSLDRKKLTPEHNYDIERHYDVVSF